MTDTGQPLPARPHPGRFAAAAMFAAVLGLALFMRLYRVAEETPHPDEITSLTGLYEKTFPQSLEAARILDPPMTPLYFLVQYAWAKAVGITVLRVRLLSVFFSLLTFLAVYRLGTRLKDRRTGLAAMALLAVSPINVYYSQEIRNYALTMLLGALSLLTLLRGVERPTLGRWATNFAVDLLLAFSHLFASLLFAAEGLFLLLCHRRRRVLLPWFISHAIIGLAVAGWLATCDFQAIRNASGFMQPLSMTSVLEMAASLTGAPYYQYLMVFHGRSVGPIVIGVFLLAALALLVDRVLAGRRPGAKSAGTAVPAHPLALFALAFAVPPLLLCLVTLCYTPCLLPRYVLCSALAAPLLLAAATTLPRAKTVRVLLVAVLVALNLYQSAVLLGRRPQRDGWTEICRFLHDNVKAEDYFVVLPPYASRFITGIEILAPASPKRTIHKEKWAEPDLRELAAWHAQGTRVWLMNHLNDQVNAELEAALTAHGLPFRRETFRYAGFALHCVPATPAAPGTETGH